MSTPAPPLFGELLKRHRQEAGLTQEALAEQAAVSTRSIQELERGASKPQKETARRLAAALGLGDVARTQFLAAATPAWRRRTPGAGRAVTLPEAMPAIAPVDGSRGPPESPAGGRRGFSPHHAAPTLVDLPTPPTALLGRASEVAVVEALFREEAIPLVTLTGPGGVGKTRLAVQVATALRSDFPDGIYLVPLTPLSDAALVLPTIARAIGLQETRDQQLQHRLRTYLAGKHLLLLLDNFEHVVAAAPAIAALRAGCPHLRMLITSRVPLHLQGEQVFPVSPLPLPDQDTEPDPAIVGQADAVRLFVQRAHAVKPDFVLTAANAGAVAAICRQLDGLPLAIELAAAWVAVLPPQVLLTQLAQPLRVLTRGARDMPERQQTLRNTLAWSYVLLSPLEQTLFRRLAVFAGGCTQEAAEAICAIAPDDAGANGGTDLLEELVSLVEKSLLQVDESAPNSLRFVMLATIRPYAHEQLSVAGEVDTLRRRHANYFLALAEEAGRHFLEATQLAWLDRLDAELDNLRAALGWCAERGQAGDEAALERGLEVAGKLYGYWHLRGRFTEGGRWLARLLAVPGAGQTRGRAYALQTAALMMQSTGDSAMAYALGHESLGMSRAIGDPPLIAHALLTLGWLDVVARTPQLEADGDTYTHLQEALRLMREIDDPIGMVQALLWLGFMLLRNGEGERATARFAEGLALSQARGDRWWAAIALNGLAETAWIRGDAATAQALATESLALHQALGDPHGSGHMLAFLGDLAYAAEDTQEARAYYTRALEALRTRSEVPRSVRVLWGFATLAAEADEPKRALQLAGAATALSTTTSVPTYPSPETRLAQVRFAAQALSPEEQAAAWATGQGMTLDQAIRLALDSVPHGPASWLGPE